MASGGAAEDSPPELREQLAGFGSALSRVSRVLDTCTAAPRSELSKMDPLDQAKLDLMSAYTLNSLFWMYLVTQGVNPREHAIKQELERIRKHMNKVKEITDRKKAARLDKGATARFLRNAFYDPKEKDSRRKAAGAAASDERQSKRPKQS